MLLLPFLSTAQASASYACADATETRDWKPGDPAVALDAAHATAVVLRVAAPTASGPELVAHVAALTQAGARCLVLPGQTSAADLRIAADLPLLGDPDALPMLGQPPMVVWGRGAEVVIGRWPLTGASMPGTDNTLIDLILGVERRNFASVRDAFVHVDPAQSAASVGAMIERLLGRGIQTVALHAGTSRWSPAPSSPPDPEAWKALPVTSTRKVFVGEDGELDLQFPLHLKRPTLTLTNTDILAYQESCTSGMCDLVVVTATERFFIFRRPDPGSFDVTRRVLFGDPVVPYAGPNLAPRSAPQTAGTFQSLPHVEFHPPSERKQGEPGYLQIVGNIDRVGVAYVLSDRHPLIRECFVGEASDYWGGLSRNPFGGIALGFDVNPDGHVRSLEILESSIANDHLEACVLDAMGATRFPASADGNPVRITWKMGFGIAD